MTAVGKFGPGAGADAAMLYTAQNHPKRCGHGKTWDEKCSDCNAVWREDQVKALHKQAAKYGFKLMPQSEGGEMTDLPKMVPSAEERVEAATIHYLGTLSPSESVPVVAAAFRDGFLAGVAPLKLGGEA